ncbi:RPA-interacting protein A [Hirschfeldia incana]|nr:RPA-interacting protein A [Hirschfeldia incana]
MDDAKLATSASTIPKRASIKSQPDFDYSIRKKKLRESCFRRVREERTRLLWKLRHSDCQSSDQKEIINSTFQDIVSDELKKIEDSHDILWEYEGPGDAYEGDSEEILLELQHMFYNDLISETTINGTHVQAETWDDEEDEYLATLVSQNMRLNGEQGPDQIWCPICKQGEVMENHRHIYCSMCEMQLFKGEEVNLNILQERLAEVHAEHFERGCRLKPKFSVQSLYNLKALYITCEACSTFEVVV